MLQCCWLTDLHLDLAPTEAAVRLGAWIHQRKPKFIALTGDIAEAPSLLDALRTLELRTSVEGCTDDPPIFFVLGNHDYYKGSIAAVRGAVSELCKESRRLFWMNESGIQQISARTCVVGHDGWYDARSGLGEAAHFVISDFQEIEDLRVQPTPEARIARMRELADEGTAYLERRLFKAARRFDEVIILTHVPPGEDLSYYKGQPGSMHSLPFFSCRSSGEMFKRVALQHQTTRFTVLCGHTHAERRQEPVPGHPNLRILVGGADYGFPAPQAAFWVP
jgi:predicted phosphohydrolase